MASVQVTSLGLGVRECCGAELGYQTPRGQRGGSAKTQGLKSTYLQCSIAHGEEPTTMGSPAIQLPGPVRLSKEAYGNGAQR